MLKKKRPKHQLIIEETANFDLIGITCGLKDYQAGWTLNKILELKLEKKDDLIIRSKTKEEIFFPVFDYTCDQGLKKYVLAGNKNNKGILSPEFKHMDYFLVVEDESLDYDPEIMIKKLNEDSAILSAIRINPHEIKARKNFSDLLQF